MLAIRLQLVFMSVACLGCAAPCWHTSRSCVDAQLFERTGETLASRDSGSLSVLPAGVECGDGLAEHEAVLAALWNNARFQELLVDLEVARADVIQARQLTNPELWSVFPVAAKQLEFALNVPLEAFWLRPRRVAAARARGASRRPAPGARRPECDSRRSCGLHRSDLGAGAPTG